MHADALGPADPDERVEVSVVLKPRQALPEVTGLSKPLTREEFAEAYGADPGDVSRVEDFAHKHGLEVVESSPSRRTVRLAGTSKQMAAAFGVSLARFRSEDGTEFRAPETEVRVPNELGDAVQGVFGLDTRPIARHHE
jgi:kumamolisin